MKIKPDGWVVLTNNNQKNLYFIFSSWKENDRWRLSSGSEVLPNLSKCGKFWLWRQQSGSYYELPVDEENGYTFYTGKILDDLLKSGSSSGMKLERVSLKSITKNSDFYN